MSVYHWSASQQVVEKLLTIRGERQRQKLADFFDDLTENPEGLSEEQFFLEVQGVDGLLAVEQIISYAVCDKEQGFKQIPNKRRQLKQPVPVSLNLDLEP